MSQQSSAVLFREIHKNAWLKLLPCQKITKISPMCKRGMKLWVVFCVHDDVDPILEFYVSQEQSAHHKPMQSVALNSTLHVSPTICAQEDEFEFVITLQSDVVRLTASSWEQMMEWVDGIQAKLREMRIMSPKENIYSKMPEQRPPLLPTRDPNSPLPLPPLGPSSLLAGVEPVQHTDTDRNATAAASVLSPVQMGMIAPSTESSEYTRGLQRLVSRVSSLADPPDPPPSSPTHNITVIEVNTSEPTSINPLSQTSHPTSSQPVSSQPSHSASQSSQPLSSNQPQSGPLPSTSQRTPQPSTSRDENVFNFAFVNDALPTEEPDVFFTPPATPGLPGSIARFINPLNSLTDAGKDPFAPANSDPFAPRGEPCDTWGEVWDCKEEEVRRWDCREDGTPATPTPTPVSHAVSVSSNSCINVVPNSCVKVVPVTDPVNVIASTTCLSLVSSSRNHVSSTIVSSPDHATSVSTSSPVSSNEPAPPSSSTKVPVSKGISVTPIVNAVIPTNISVPAPSNKSTPSTKPIPPPLCIPKSRVQVGPSAKPSVPNTKPSTPSVSKQTALAQSASNVKSTSQPASPQLPTPKPSSQPISHSTKLTPAQNPKIAQISNAKSSQPKTTVQPSSQSASKPSPNPAKSSNLLSSSPKTQAALAKLSELHILIPKPSSHPVSHPKSASPPPTSPLARPRRNSTSNDQPLSDANGHNLYEHLSEVRSGNNGATPAVEAANSQANNNVRSRPSSRPAVNPQPNRPRKRSSSNSEATGHLPHVPADRIRVMSQRSSEQITPQRIGSTPVISQTSSPTEAPLVNASRLTLREQQVLQLRREMMHPGGVRLQLKRKDCVNSIALVDAFNAVWIAGWKQLEHPMLYGALHIGDQVLKIMGQPVHSAAEAQKLIRSKHGIYVEFVILRVPRGRVYAICRETQGQSLGIVQDGTAEIKDVLPGSLVQASGIPAKTTTMDGLGLTTWWITEINGRPLNLFFKDNEVKDRLNCVGLDISLLIQPFDLIKQIKKQMKSSIRSYKDYIVQ